MAIVAAERRFVPQRLLDEWREQVGVFAHLFLKIGTCRQDPHRVTEQRAGGFPPAPKRMIIITCAANSSNSPVPQAVASEPSKLSCGSAAASSK